LLYDWNDVEVGAYGSSCATPRKKAMCITKAKQCAESLFNEEFGEDLTEKLNQLLLPNEAFIRQIDDFYSAKPK
jgi:hypothetical protein